MAKLTQKQRTCPYCHAPFKALLQRAGKRDIGYYESPVDHDISLTFNDPHGFDSRPANFCMMCGRPFNVATTKTPKGPDQHA